MLSRTELKNLKDMECILLVPTKIANVIHSTEVIRCGDIRRVQASLRLLQKDMPSESVLLGLFNTKEGTLESIVVNDVLNLSV